jgi:hypothetical protein
VAEGRTTNPRNAERLRNSIVMSASS